MRGTAITVSLCIMAACVVAARAVVPQPGVARDRVDLAEVQHYYDGEGRLVFDQLILWRWNTDAARYDCQAWRLIKSSAMLPRRDWGADEYSVTWFDGELLRDVRVKQVRETWSQVDSELADRDVLPKECRRELTTARDVSLDQLQKQAAAKWKGVGQ